MDVATIVNTLAYYIETRGGTVLIEDLYQKVIMGFFPKAEMVKMLHAYPTRFAVKGEFVSLA